MSQVRLNIQPNLDKIIKKHGYKSSSELCLKLLNSWYIVNHTK